MSFSIVQSHLARLLLVATLLCPIGCAPSHKPLGSDRGKPAKQYQSAVEKLEAAGAAAYCDDVGEVTFVDFYRCNNIESLLPLLSEFSKLETLNFSSVPVTDEGLKSLEGLTSLKTLALNGSKVSDAGMQSLANLDQLTQLNLNNTNVTDTGIGKLSVLTGLQQIRLQGTAVTDESLAIFKQFPELTLLWMNGTAFSDQAADELRSQSPDVQIMNDPIDSQAAPKESSDSPSDESGSDE